MFENFTKVQLNFILLKVIQLLIQDVNRMTII